MELAICARNCTESSTLKWRSFSPHVRRPQSPGRASPICLDVDMVGYSWLLAIFTIQLITAAVTTRYFPNHKYDQDIELTLNQTNQKDGRHRVNKLQPQYHLSSQLRSSPTEATITAKGAGRTTTNNDNDYPTKTAALKNQRSYENFVTPEQESLLKRYEVTTEEFQDTESEPSPVSAALDVDNDVAIALDDEDVSHVVEPVDYRPEHVNPLVYLDSYGRVHGKGQSPRGSGWSGVVRPPRHFYSRTATGRVRMQVFRGPTRIVGHKRFAPWGYYVVQPSGSPGPHRYPGPPFIHSY